MGRVLFIRVSAVTYEEKAVREAWPFLTDLAWPKPLLAVQDEDDEEEDAWGAEDKDADGPNVPEDAQPPKITKGKKSGWKFRLPWSKKPGSGTPGEQAAANNSKKRTAAKASSQSKKILPSLEDIAPKGPHGVLDLIDRLADMEHSDLELELMHVLDEYVPKLTELRRELDRALSDWDVKHAHKLTNTIEEILDAAEKDCYY